MLRLFCGFTVLYFSACGAFGTKKSGQKDDNVVEEGIFTEKGMQGLWHTICIVDKNDGGSNLVHINFYSNRIDYKQFIFSDSECKPENLEREYDEKYQHSYFEKVPHIEGWHTVNYAIESITTTPRSDQNAAILSRKNRYGYSDWHKDETKDITGRRWDDSSEPKRQKGDARRRTFKVEDNKLYMARYQKNGKAEPTDNPNFVLMR